MAVRHAFVVDGDPRVVFAERNDHADVTLLWVGIHEEVHDH
jgi:hypothetical protein